MNKYLVYAWLDDLQMSTQLAKFTNLHSYNLNFFGDDVTIYEITNPTVLIVDLLRLSKNDLNYLLNLPKTELITIIGYLHEISGSKVKYFNDYGCHMVLGRNELLKNLNSILKKIFHAD